MNVNLEIKPTEDKAEALEFEYHFISITRKAAKDLFDRMDEEPLNPDIEEAVLNELGIVLQRSAEDEFGQIVRAEVRQLLSEVFYDQFASHIFVATAKNVRTGHLAGIISGFISEGGSEADLQDIEINKALRNKGIEDKLHNFVETKLRSNSIVTLNASALDINREHQDFLRANGYQEMEGVGEKGNAPTRLFSLNLNKKNRTLN